MTAGGPCGEGRGYRVDCIRGRRPGAPSGSPRAGVERGLRAGGGRGAGGALAGQAARGVIAAGDGVEAPAGLPVLRVDPDGDVPEEALQRFLFDECGCAREWTVAAFIERAIAQVRAQV